MRKHQGKRSGYRGASLIEAALALPFMMLFITAAIDICRYGLAVAILNYAAFRAADYAAKNQFEIDTRPSACSLDASTCSRYITVFNGATQAALSIAHSIASASTSPGMITLRPFTHYYDGEQNTLAAHAGTPSGMVTDMGLIRPGEKAQEADGRERHHSRRPFDASGGASVDGGYGWPQQESSWAAILESNPIEIQIEADIRFVTPLLSTGTIRVHQSAWRRTGAFGVPIAPSAALPPNIPSVVPSEPPGTVPPGTIPPVPDEGTPTPAPTLPTPPPWCSTECTSTSCNLSVCFQPAPLGCNGCNAAPGD